MASPVPSAPRLSPDQTDRNGQRGATCYPHSRVDSGTLLGKGSAKAVDAPLAVELQRATANLEARASELQQALNDFKLK